MAKSVKITDLKFDDKNFNTGSEYGNSLIKKSFLKFGAGRSIVLDKNNRIIAGNKSVTNAVAMGLTDVQIVESDGKRMIAVKRMDIDLDSPEGREMALADNASAKANIILDAELIEAELGIAICEEWGVEPVDDNQAADDDFEIPENIETGIVLGDLIEIGKHRLLCGSCLDKENWKLLMNGQLLDVVVTDPPYNVDYQGGDRTEMKARHRRVDGLKIANDKMTDSQFYSFLLSFYVNTAAYTKAGGIWYVWHADMETVNFRTAMIAAGLTPKQCLIWNKGVMVMGRQDYHWKHEPCIYGWKEGAAHGWYSDRKQTTVLEFERPTRSKEHPTMKPVPLIAYQIQNSSKAGDIVGDSFLGSGTTMVAADQLNRTCFGMEIDPKYCQVIVNRMLKLHPAIEIKINSKPYAIQ
jgi:DNA modification methylase